MDDTATTRRSGPRSDLRRFVPVVLCAVVLVTGLASASIAAGDHAGPSGGATTRARLLDGPVAPTGYWLVASDGGVFAFGDAAFHGSTGDLVLNQPMVGMAATPSGHGYWLVAADGGVFAFGDAGFYGSTGGLHLNRAMVGMAATPSGHGYWLAAADGGVFAFGDAGFHGSAGALTLVSPVGAISATSDGGGYWMAAGDGGVFNYGDADFDGSATGVVARGSVVDLQSTSDSQGYWLTASDGGVFALGNAPFFGSAGNLRLTRPVVGMAAISGPTVNPREYTISGDASATLAPGTSAAIDLRITNPNPVPITVLSTTTTVTSPDPACGPTNFQVAQGPTQPVVVAAGTSATLSELGLAGSDWPTVTMVETGTDQDACQHLQLTLHYEGEAVG